MIPEYYVREEDLFRYGETVEDTTTAAEGDTTASEEDESQGEGETP